MSYNGKTYQNTCTPCKHTWKSQGKDSGIQPCPLCGKKNTVVRVKIMSAGGNYPVVGACA